MTDPDSSSTSPAAGSAERGERIAKRLARAGLCSRRDAERWIAEGRVSVNGTVLDSPACVVGPNDRIVADGKLVPAPEQTRVWRYHKPDGLVTTARDEKGRATVFERLPPEMPRVVSVGRLDLSSEGLLLLTNDGELARHLELPATGWLRRYRVRVFGVPDPAQLAALKAGVTVEGITYGPIEAELERQVGHNAWLVVALREGRNREVRKVMEYLGLPVSRLIRVAYGPFQLGKLERGAVEEVPRRVLRDQMPDFFPKEERAKPADSVRVPSITRPVTIRFDQLPKGSGGTAGPSARPPGRGRTAASASAAPAASAEAGPAAGRVRAVRVPRPAKPFSEQENKGSRRPTRDESGGHGGGGHGGGGHGSGGQGGAGQGSGGRSGGRNADRRR
jgi:23S rRNA pseudouridine2605 synthase